jgi:hypothetical protein
MPELYYFREKALSVESVKKGITCGDPYQENPAKFK